MTAVLMPTLLAAVAAHIGTLSEHVDVHTPDGWIEHVAAETDRIQAVVSIADIQPDALNDADVGVGSQPVLIILAVVVTRRAEEAPGDRTAYDDCLGFAGDVISSLVYQQFGQPILPARFLGCLPLETDLEDAQIIGFEIRMSVRARLGDNMWLTPDRYNRIRSFGDDPTFPIQSLNQTGGPGVST